MAEMRGGDPSGTPGRLYFDLVSNDEIIRDRVGVVSTDVAASLAYAREVIAEIANSGQLGVADGAWSMIVRDADGRVVTTLTIARTGPSLRGLRIVGYDAAAEH